MRSVPQQYWPVFMHEPIKRARSARGRGRRRRTRSSRPCRRARASRDQLAAARLGDLAAGGDAARERDLVDARRSRGAAPVWPSPIRTSSTPSGSPASAKNSPDQRARERGVTSEPLSSTALPATHRLRGLVHREHERAVPGHDDADHAERLVHQRELLRQARASPWMRRFAAAGSARRSSRSRFSESQVANTSIREAPRSRSCRSRGSPCA